LRRPGSADVGVVGREQLIDAHQRVGPVDQVVGFHQDQRAVVAPAIILARAFPFGAAQAGVARVDVQVGHRHIKGVVGAAHQVRVAHALLLAQSLAR